MYSLVISSLFFGASALSLPRSSCSFGLTASGGESGTIGQLSDGQNRIGGGLSAATFTINNGGITDAAGRGCILTPSVEQFQCDQGVGPTYGFSIASNGTLMSSGSSVFYACPASDTEWNLYTIPVVGQLKCVEISLTASDCGASSGWTNSTTSSTSPSSSAEAVTVTVYNCGLASSASSAAALSTSPVVETETVVPVAQSSSQAASPSTAPGVTESSVQAVSTVTPEASVYSSSTAVGQSSAQAFTTVQVSSVIQSATSVEAATSVGIEGSTPAVTSTPEATYTQATSVTSAVQSSTSAVVSSLKSISTPVESTTPVVGSSSSQGVTTEIVYTSTTVCPVTLTHTTGGTTSLETTSSSSTVYITSTSTVCTICEAASSTTSAVSSIIISSTSSTVASYSASTYVSTSPVTSATAVSAQSSSVASSVQSSSTCSPTTLTGTYTNGNYQYPHLIIPVSSSTPDTAAGTQYFGTISTNTSTIFNFDIPSSYSGHTCNLIFLLPLQSELETSSYTFSGTGTIDFEQLATAATSETTYDNAPSVSANLGEFTLTEGSSTLIKTFSCDAYAGTTATYEMVAVGDTYLYYFQDWNPSPLGLYVTVC